MANDLLSAIGTRLEAQLKARVGHIRSVDDGVKAKVANTPAVFRIPENTKGVPHVSSVDESVSNTADTPPSGEAELSVGEMFQRVVIRPEDVVRAKPAMEQVQLNPIVESSVTEVTLSATQIDLVAKAQSLANAAVAVDSTTNAATTIDSAAPVATPVAAPAAPMSIAQWIAQQMATPQYTPTPAMNNVGQTTVAQSPVSVMQDNLAAQIRVSNASTPATSSPATGNSAASNSTVGNIPSSNEGSSASAAATRTVVVNGVTTTVVSPGGFYADGTPMNYTPPVPPEFGVGATFRRHGVGADTPMTVTRVGNGVVFAMYTDEEGTREMPFTFTQLDLVTAAP